MQGRLGSQLVAGCIMVLVLAVAGCDDRPASPPPPPATPDGAASQYDASTTGTIRGRVTWTGALPEVEPFRAPLSPLSEHPGGNACLWPNPNAPVIDLHGHGVAGAVVYLRGVDPRRARPWAHTDVTVELREHAIHIVQGNAEQRTGLVRRGAAVKFRSVQEDLDSVQARGDAFFALPFPPHAEPCRRTLSQCGVVELMSGAGHFWMRGYLMVSDHPYLATTEADGRFVLEHVPPGEYEIVCWHPSWHEAAHERDADTGLWTRLVFRPPMTVIRPIAVTPLATAAADFVLSADLFDR
jgi:hypothetical protein